MFIVSKIENLVLNRLTAILYDIKINTSQCAKNAFSDKLERLKRKINEVYDGINSETEKIHNKETFLGRAQKRLWTKK